MDFITRSYIRYARGESRYSPWCVLRPLGWIGAAIIKTRGFLYDHGIYASQESALPVISVGNLALGGTNKTPFVEYIVRRLVKSGVKPGIVSRGYGGKGMKNSSPIVIVDCNAERSVASDEPLLLSDHLPGVPVAVSSDRLADVRALLDYGVDVVVADDAFQHRRLARDADIVLIDAICPFGNGSTIPSGTLRELPRSLKRAHIAVITKSDQISHEELEALKKKLGRWISPDRVFSAKLGQPDWEEWDGRKYTPCENLPKDLRLVAFSGIGNPRSFKNTVVKCGVSVLKEIVFSDHHRYRMSDLKMVEDAAARCRADAICCTEKDVFNLPKDYIPSIKLYVPKIRTVLDDEARFWAAVLETLRPKFVVASNGYGEDAIGSRLAAKARDAFPLAEIIAFPLVGLGEPYRKQGIKIAAPLTDSPTGGIVKYHLKDLYREIRAGLFSHIGSQIGAWKSLRHSCRTVLCVGDAYLLAHTLWGQGKKALMIATAKTQFISGHLKVETNLFKRRSQKVWTRDEETAAALRKSGVSAVFRGNPIMDLQPLTEASGLWGEGRRILVLPGSRERTYDDLPLLLDTLIKIAANTDISVVMVAALSIDTERLARSAKGWDYADSCLKKDNVTIRVYKGEVAEAASGAELLLGLAGTANQVCAGMGIPVLSIEEKGKFVQKKLLGDSELLVHADPDTLSRSALELLGDPQRLKAMSEAGIRRLGGAGALDSVLEYASEELGWKKRCLLYGKLRDNLI